MEKVWDELKKIEAQATQIKLEAQTKSKEIIEAAKREAEKLSQNSKTYAKEESEKLFQKTVDEANQKRDAQLKVNQQETQKMQAQAEANMPKAVEVIVKGVLGERAV